MKFSLTEEQMKFIQENIVDKFKATDSEIYIFGSRAKGTSQKFSDIDILIKTKKITPEINQLKSSIEEQLENSNFPFKVDLVFEHELAKSYRDEILSTAIKIRK